MMQINSYLTFNGNCREAMSFYQKCLGGELMFQPLGDSPLAEKMPQQMKEYILHSSLTSNGFSILGSDMAPESGIIRGNAVSLALSCASEDEIRNAFHKLSEDGIVKHPIETTFWGALFGDLTDKFGNNWLLIFNNPSLGN